MKTLITDYKQEISYFLFFDIRKIVKFCVVIFFSCSNNQKDEDKIFSDYLKEVHNIKSSEKSRFYIIIPTINKCQGCIDIIKKDLAKRLLTDSTFTLITSDASIFQYFKNKKCKNILFCKKRVIDRLNLTIFNFTSVEMYNGKVHRITSFDSKQINEIINFLNK